MFCPVKAIGKTVATERRMERDMKYITKNLDFQLDKRSVVTLGKFDGVHKGHSKLINRVLEIGKEGYETVVFTFDVSPLVRLGTRIKRTILTNEERRILLERRGVECLVECPFVPEIIRMEPEDFIREILVKQLRAAYVVVGPDFHFGHNRMGDYRLLLEYADKFGYEVQVIEKIQSDGRDISSTYIREYIKEGNIEKANELLGYSFFVQGIVEHGNEIGRTIGFPTVNLVPEADKLLPPFGVYITRILIGGEEYCGITNVGCKPTIEGDNRIGVETHVLDFSDDVYDMAVEVEFLHRIRAEVKFASIDELKAQLQQDIKIARIYFDL